MGLIAALAAYPLLRLPQNYPDNHQKINFHQPRTAAPNYGEYRRAEARATVRVHRQPVVDRTHHRTRDDPSTTAQRAVPVYHCQGRAQTDTHDDNISWRMAPNPLSPVKTADWPP